MKFTRREIQVFYFCVSLLLLFILDRLIFRPLAGKITSLVQEIHATEAKLARGLRTERQKDLILKQYGAYEDYLKLKGSDEEIVSAFLSEIERLSRDAGISVSDIKPRGTKELGLYKEYTIEVRCDASLKDLVKFLYRMNDSKLLLKVNKLSLSLADENSELLKTSMVITGIALL